MTAEERHARYVAGGKARAALPDFLAHQRRNFQITAERYGFDFARKKAAQHRERNPSAGEAWLVAQLTAWGYQEGADFRREQEIAYAGSEIYLDCVLHTAEGLRLVIEIDGNQHTKDAARRADAARDAWLLDTWEFRTLRLPSRLIARHPDDARRQLYQALQQAAAAAESGTWEVAA